MMTSPNLHNPQLDGQPFILEGKPTGLLLIHGLAGTPAEVRRLGRNLHRAGFTISAPLLPGHRETPAALKRTRWQDWYAAGEDAYAQLAGRCERVFAGGQSTGALLALLLAARHPELAGVLAFAPALQAPLTRFQRLALPLLSRLSVAVPHPGLSNDRTWQGYPVYPLGAVYQHRRLEATVLRELARVTQPLLLAQGRLDTSTARRLAEQVFAGVQSDRKEMLWLEQTSRHPLLDKDLPQLTLATLNFIYQAR